MRRAWIAIAGLGLGCHAAARPAGDDGIRVSTAPPGLPPQLPPPAELPRVPEEAESAKPGESLPAFKPAADGTPLALAEVLASVERHFPLLLAVQEERNLALGQRLVAQGAFDVSLRSSFYAQGGSFVNQRYNVSLEQPIAAGGAGLFAGYRIGQPDDGFPVYYGERLTAEAGEFRAGVALPLLRDAKIDRRRAARRQAEIQQQLADPVIRRARLDYFLQASRTYWNWVASGEQVLVAEDLLRLAADRQTRFEAQLKAGQIAEFVAIDNRRTVAERAGAKATADRRFQQASLALSLFSRDERGEPLIPAEGRLPRDFIDLKPQKPDPTKLAPDADLANVQRPELLRFHLLKEQATVELRQSENLYLPGLNATLTGAQDVGRGKKSSGINALDRSNVEAGLVLDVPLQRSEATGRIVQARANLARLLAQERQTRDQIRAEVQDAVSALVNGYEQLTRAREELAASLDVAKRERARFATGAASLLEVNLRELAAASSEARVVEALANFLRAEAEYRAALGVDR